MFSLQTVRDRWRTIPPAAGRRPIYSKGGTICITYGRSEDAVLTSDHSGRLHQCGVIESARARRDQCVPQACPDVELRLIVQPTTPLLAQLSQDQIDVAFLRPTSTERQTLRAIPLPDERLWIAVPSGHALAARKRVRLDELRDEPFILYPRANGSLLYDSIIAACQSAGFSPRVVQEAPQMASMVSLVAAGVGVTLVPECVCQLRPAGVRYNTR